MSNQPTVSDDDIKRAIKRLAPEYRNRVKVETARRAFAVVLDKRTRNGRLDAVRFTLKELNIGNTGHETARQKEFGAYWRLLRRYLESRERCAHSAKKTRRAA